MNGATGGPGSEGGESMVKKMHFSVMSAQPVQVKVHPTILLGIVDHFNRINPRHEGNRAVGMLLGTRENSDEGLVYDISNYYAGTFFPS